MHALVLVLSTIAYAQEKSDFEKYAESPKPNLSFPLEYKIVLPTCIFMCNPITIAHASTALKIS
jgi:hypothetical protein